MRWGKNLRLSARALTRSRARTALSVSGVAVGIASVVVLIGAGVGAERALREALEPLGRNLLVVSPTRSETNALRGTGRVATTLEIGDWQAVAELPDVARAAPVAEQPRLARAGGRAVPVRVAGTTPAFAEVRNIDVVAGRFLEAADLEARRRVVVVGALVVEELYEGESPLGEIVHLGGVPFEIVGVTKRKGVSSDGANEDELVFVPLATAMRRLLDVDYLSFVYAQTVTEEAIPIAREKIQALLRERHALAQGAADDFGIQDQTAVVRAQQRAGGSLGRLVIGLSALALGLGGVGLLAVSLLSVRERYAEIGLRLAVGGRPREVLVQFLVEAVLVSALGGVVGVGLGAGGIVVGSALTRWSMALAWQAAVYPLTISLAIALVFGAYPAAKAARLDPIEALHSR